MIIIYFCLVEKYLFIVFLNFLMTTAVTLWAPDYLLEFFKVCHVTTIFVTIILHLSIFQFKPIPNDFRIRLFIISICNFIFCFLWQKCFLEGFVERRLLPFLKRRFNYCSSKKYHKIHELIKRDRWPFDQMICRNGEGPSELVLENEALCSDDSGVEGNILKISKSVTTFKQHQTSFVS